MSVRNARDVARLADAPEVTVWTPPTEGPNAKAIWAPELHRIGDKWYIYYSAAASGSEGDARRGVFVLENAGDDPTTGAWIDRGQLRSEEHTSELQSLMRISYAVFCLKKKKQQNKDTDDNRRDSEQM